MKVIFINTRSAPYISLIGSLRKPYETRTRDTLRSCVGERVLLAETGKGKPIVCLSAIIDHVIIAETKAVWDSLRSLHCVPVGSRHDWKPETKRKYLYHLAIVEKVAPFVLPDSAIRHGRTWAEI